MAAHSFPVLGPRYFTRFYEEKLTEPSAYLQRLVDGRNIYVRAQRPFSDVFGKLGDKSVLGFRIFDFKQGWHYAPALAESGRFFLLSRSNEALRNPDNTVMEFTFVGAAKNGLLRVCVGGKLAIPEAEEIPTEPLSSLYSLLEDFSLSLDSGTLQNSISSLVVRSSPGDSARWGVLDTLGRWVVPPVYDYVEENIDGQMIARRGVYHGVVNKQGATIVPFQYRKVISYKGFWRVNTKNIGEVYFNWRGHQIVDVGADSVSFFREGYAARLIDGRWSYINEQGEPLAGSDYLQAKSFGEGLAAVQMDSTSWAFIDTSGQLQGRLSTETYQDLGYFVGGRCWFRQGAKFGFLDRSLQIVIPPRFSSVSDFHRDRAIAKMGSSVAVIDTSGNFLVKPERYSDITPWNEAGRAVATVAGDGKYLLDFAGNPLHEESFSEIILKGDPPYLAKRERDWGYIDEQAKEVIEPIYTAATPFTNKRARVKTFKSGDRWVYINPVGRTINKQAYRSASDFSEGIAAVQPPNQSSRLLQLNGQELMISNCDNLFVDGPFLGCNPNGLGGKKAFFADHSGSPVFLYTYDKIKPFGSMGMAFVKASGRWGIIDRRGMSLVACKYYMFSSRPDGIFKVGPPIFGIYDRKGKMVVPAKFDNLVLMEKGIFRVERGENVGYLTVDGEVVWPLQK
jgi:hypothetical protein